MVRLLTLILVLASTQAASAQWWSRRSDHEKESPAVLELFKPLTRSLTPSMCEVISGERLVLGTVVGADGWVVSKASEVEAPVRVRLEGDQLRRAQIHRVSVEHDLVLLKIEATGLQPVRWRTDNPPELGTWLVSLGASPDPLAIGILSVKPRRVGGDSSNSKAFLGIEHREVEGALVVDNVIEGSAAALAGLKTGDTLRFVDGRPIASRSDLLLMLNPKRPGDPLQIVVERDTEVLDIRARLGEWPGEFSRRRRNDRLAGDLSTRRSLFPEVMQHDSILEPEECGGVVVDLDGKACGLNIARAGRIATYAIPARIVVDFVQVGMASPPVPNAGVPLAEAEPSAKTSGLGTLGSSDTSNDQSGRLDGISGELGRMKRDLEVMLRFQQVENELEALRTQVEGADPEIRSRLTKSLEEIERLYQELRLELQRRE